MAPSFHFTHKARFYCMFICAGVIRASSSPHGSFLMLRLMILVLKRAKGNKKIDIDSQAHTWEDEKMSELAALSLAIGYMISLSQLSMHLCWRRQCHPTPVLLPGKSHGWGSLVGCSPWGREESDMAERLHFHFSLSCTAEGTGNPLQCSCLENPRDGGAWWAAVYGVAQSWTRLK